MGEYTGSVNGDFEMEVASESGDAAYTDESTAGDSVSVEGAHGYSSARIYSPSGSRADHRDVGRSSAVAPMMGGDAKSVVSGISPPKRYRVLGLGVDKVIFE